MPRLKFLIVLLFLFPKLVTAQYEHLLHQSYAEKVTGIHAMYKDLIDTPDSVARAVKAEEIKDFARKHQDRALELNVDFFLVFWNAFYQRQPKDASLRTLTDQLELATEENVDFLRARSLRALAEFYWGIEKITSWLSSSTCCWIKSCRLPKRKITPRWPGT